MQKQKHISIILKKPWKATEKFRDKFYQLWIKTKSPEVFDRYKVKRNEVNKEINAAKRNDVQNKVDRDIQKELFKSKKKDRGE